MPTLKKLFLSANLNTLSGQHGEHIKATINSCRKNTDLEIYVLWSGKKNEYYNWMKDKVNLVDISEFPIQKAVVAVPVPEVWTQGHRDIGMGAWGRIDLPSVFNKLNITDEYALYTDIDVLFTEKWSPIIEPINTLGMAIQKNHVDYNSGVMIINCEFLKSTYPSFEKYILNKGIEKFKVWDQTALNEFYGPRIHKLESSIWNWSAYRNEPVDNARIIHFHGPKLNYLKNRIEKNIDLTPSAYSRMFNEGPNQYKWLLKELYKYL